MLTRDTATASRATISVCRRLEPICHANTSASNAGRPIITQAPKERRDLVNCEP